MKLQKTEGFTLIELLVVIAIIVLLATMVIINLSKSQLKGRDARRLEDLHSIQSALAMYQVGHKRFPVATATTTLTGTDAISTALTGDGAIQEMPLDPLYPDYSYKYISNALGTDYSLVFCIEGNSVPRYSAGCNNIMHP